MQIKKLLFYNSEGGVRHLDFDLGRVNIITGESKTGKSALIDIIDYCLGSGDCKISEGVIRNTVEWFGIILQMESDQIFIARQNPNRLGQTSTQNIYLAHANLVEIPDLGSLVNNSSIAALRDFLTKKLFISEFTNVPEDGTRQPLTVTFKHSRFFSFQPQDLIAQRNFLFFNQTDNFVAQSMKDTLPYLLGAVREDTVRIEQAISQKRRELSRLEKEIKEFERLKEDGTRKLVELIDEAKQLNLLSSEIMVGGAQQSIEILRTVVQWRDDSIEEVQGENANLKKLLDEKIELAKQLGRLNDDVDAVNAFIGQTADYSSEVGQQKIRLESINLFEENGGSLHSCPLCSQNIETEIPSIKSINESLENLAQNLNTTIAERPKLAAYVDRLEVERGSLKKNIEIKENGIRAIYLEQDEARRQKDVNLRRGKIIGKISLFLESFKEAGDESGLRLKASSLESEIEELQSQISGDEKESRLNSILNQINTQMTAWSGSLDLEHQNSPIHFDLKKLTIFADTPLKSIPLTQMGSGANWVAYHLLIHFALHKHFVQAERPIPRFLVLDQPSQIYYPPERDPELKGIIPESSDEKAVRQMYEFIFKITKELSPKFQVIITDHAKLNFPDFAESITEEWRNGSKLIPTDWY